MTDSKYRYDGTFCTVKTPTKEKPMGHCWGLIEHGKCIVCGKKYEQGLKMTNKKVYEFNDFNIRPNFKLLCISCILWIWLLTIISNGEALVLLIFILFLLWSFSFGKFELINGG